MNICIALWAAVIFCADRVTKWMALRLDGTYRVNAFFEYKRVLNRGISWGLFHSQHTLVFALINLCVGAMIIGFCIYAYRQHQKRRSIFASVAVITGAVSNLIDRILYGGVVDFIHVHVNRWSWPIFNIADVAIVLGIVWILWEQWHE